MNYSCTESIRAGNMKIALLILSFLFIGAAVSQVTREECLQTGIMDGDLPATVPVENTATDGPCTNNSCCTSAYIDRLGENVRNDVFRECIRDTFKRVIDIAEDYFDDFADLFGNFGRNALFSSFSARAEIGDDTRDVYIDNELTYISQLLANITFARLRGVTDTSNFRAALQEYSCGFLASQVQKNFYNSTLRIGRISGKCICRLTTEGGTTVLEIVNTIIDALINRFTSIIDNILRLVRAISGIRSVSIQNLRSALDYNVSSICSRQFINAVACRHCQGSTTRGCPASCRLVSLFCLQPLSNALTKPYQDFINYVRLSLSTIVGNNSDSIGAFDLHNVQEITGVLNRQLILIYRRARQALSVSILSDQTVENNPCFITKSRDIEDGTFTCRDSTDFRKNDSVPLCTRVDGEKEIVDIKTDTGLDDGTDSEGDRSDSTSPEIDTDSGTESESDSDDFERTNAERYFEKFIRVLSERFKVFGNFNLIFNRISQCVCRASSSGSGDSGTGSSGTGSSGTGDSGTGDSGSRDSGSVSGGDDSSGRDRLTTLFISPSQSQSCFERYPGNASPRGLEDNPTFESLTADEMTQTRMFANTVGSRFTDLAQTVEDDPSLSATFSQLMGEVSAAGRTLTSFLLVLCGAILALLFMLI